MEKQSFSMKKVIIIAGAFCAFWIGSGFATGQEVLQFAATSGAAKGIATAAVYAGIMIFLMYTLYGLGQKMQFENPYDVFTYYCGKTLGQLYIWFTVILSYATYVLMMSAAGNTLHQYYGVPIKLGSCVVAIFVLGTVVLGVEKLLNIIGVIGPIKILFLAIMGIASLVTLAKDPSVLSTNSAIIHEAGFLSASGNWLWSAVLWGLLGLMTGIIFFIISGSSCKSVKEARAAGILGIGAVIVVIVLMIVMEIVYLDVIRGQQIPTLAIAKYISPILSMVFAPVLAVCIYSAGTSILLTVCRKFSIDKTKNFNLIALGLTIVGMLTSSLLPFDKLVNVLFPLSGYIGILLFLLMIYKEFINKNAFPYTKASDEDKDLSA